MDLLNNLEYATLHSLLTPIQHELRVPFLSTKHHTKLALIESSSRLALSHLCPIVFDQLHTNDAEDGIVVIFDLDYTWNTKNPHYAQLASKLTRSQLNRLVLDHNTPDIGTLIKKLRSLQMGTLLPSHSSNAVLLVIIHNVSIFHWTTELEDTTTRESEALRYELDHLTNGLGCSLVLTSFDMPFETGIMKRTLLQTESPHTLRHMTNIPQNFMNTFDHVFYLYDEKPDGVRGKYFARGKSGVMITKGKLHQ